MLLWPARAVLPVLLLLLASPVAASETADCEKLLSQAPETEAPAQCLYEAARGLHPSRAAAALRLEQWARADPGRPWPTLYLGYLKWMQGRIEEAEALYRKAVAASAARGMPRAELLSRSALARILRDTGRMEEAGEEVERVSAIAAHSRSPFLQARAGILRANHWIAMGDMERAYAVLGQIERAVAEEGSYPLTRDYLFALSNVAQQTGRFRETEQGCRRLAALAAANGDVSSEAMARFGLARLRLDELNEMPGGQGRAEVLALARESLAAARAAQRPSLEAHSLWVLGSLMHGAEAAGYLQRCFEVADTPRMRSYCQGTLARRLAPSAPAAADVAIHEALSLAQESGDVLARTSSWHERMRVNWWLNPPEAAWRDGRMALDAIEALRDQQGGSVSQPGLFSTWAESYYWLSGALLEAGQAGRAFGVVERMRSRTLIDALGLSRPGPGLSPALYAGRADIFLDIARVQRRLFDPSLNPAERAGAQAELDRLERQESALRARIARGNPALQPSSFASLAQVREALAQDEALLSFQIAPWKDLAGDFGGGSWLLVLTRGATRAYRLPGRTELRPAVTTFLGLFEARNGSEARGASVLYDRLMAPALSDLPPGIRRLAIIPDDFLHRLPFASLRAEPDATPLAVRYEIELAPSATLWLRWRKTRPAPAVAPALVLADPVTLATEGRAAGERSAAVLAPVRLGPLPFARSEGRAVVRHLGGGELLLGKNASESYLKRKGAGPYGLLHFAAHAVTDAVHSERTGVYLSPGDPREDGLLQVREIADMNLDGRIVVLSTCESASGEILRGEGVMGLARAFFQAGAHTVVASLWPLRDDDGAALFDRFYRHLAEGGSVAAALQAAQRDRMTEGAPAAAWAGVVVLGDGDRVPVPGGRGPGWAAWTLGLIAALSAGLLVRRRLTSAR